MNISELARRLCEADLIHSAEKGAVFAKPCVRHIVLAQNYWGLASDPKAKDLLAILVQIRTDKLGKHA